MGGWSIRRREVAGFDYFDVDTEPSLGIRPEPNGQAEIVIYVAVENLDAAVSEAQRLGARVRIPPMSHESLRFALIEDPQGNPIGLTQAAPA